jgi:hypothetical protein
LVPDVVPAGSDLDADPTCQSLIRLESTGTKDDAMVERARPKAEHALRVLRVALRKHDAIHDRQLRFRLGPQTALGEAYSERGLPAGSSYPLDVESYLCDFVAVDILATIAPDTTHAIEKRAVRALKWLERARFEDDPTVTCLFLFFALETLLGDTSSGEKASHLCFYRCVLGEMAGRGFRHPFATYFLYDRVRSKAVHGSESVEIDEDVVKKLEWDVRNALYELVTFARAEKIVKHSKLLQALREHETARSSWPGWKRTSRRTMMAS